MGITVRLGVHLLDRVAKCSWVRRLGRYDVLCIERHNAGLFYLRFRPVVLGSMGLPAMVW